MKSIYRRYFSSFTADFMSDKACLEIQPMIWEMILAIISASVTVEIPGTVLV